LIINFEGKLLLVSASRIENNYESVGIIAVGQFITTRDLLLLYPDEKTVIELFLDNKTFVRSNYDEDVEKIKSWKKTNIAFPEKYIGKNQFTATLHQDISKSQQEYWFGLIIVSLIFAAAGAFIVAISRKLVTLNNELERTQRKIAEQKFQDSQDQIHLLLDSTAEAIYGIDASGKCTFINQSCLDMLGYKESSELLGKNMHDRIHHSYSDGSQYPIDKCKILQTFDTHEESHIDDEVLWRKDGSSFASEYWSHPIFKETKCIGVIVTFLDITDRIEVHKALREREQNLEITLNSIGDGVIATDVDGYVTRMNPVAENLTGWTLQEAQGKSVKTIFQIINASTREPIPNPIEKILVTGEIIYLSNHTTLISKNGTEYQISDSAAPIRSHDDKILGMILIFSDILTGNK